MSKTRSAAEPTGPKKDLELMKALRLIVHRGGGAKKVACWLWPGMRVPTAHGRLLASLDHRRRERLSPEEFMMLLRLGRDLADHTGMELFASMCGYSKPYSVSTEDERADVQRRYIKAATEQREAADRYEALLESAKGKE